MWRLDMTTLQRNGGQITQGTKSRILARASQIFPLTLFPDELIVEELRIVWLIKKGPWTNEIVSIMASDIASVNCASGPFFGQIHVQSLTGGPEIMVNNLLRRDVYNVRSLVEGIALSARERLTIEDASLQTERDNLMRVGAIN